MDMCWYVSRCLVSGVFRHVVSTLNCMVSSIVGILNCFSCRLGSLSDVVKCECNRLICHKAYVSKLV